MTDPHAQTESPEPAGADRRRSSRHESRVQRAWVGWRREGEFHTTPAWILDVSLGGLQLATAEEPPQGEYLLVQLDGGLLPVWYEARVLAIQPDPHHVWLVRLAFPDQCPYDLFLATVYGYARGDGSATQPELKHYAQSQTVETRPKPREYPFRASWAR